MARLTLGFALVLALSSQANAGLVYSQDFESGVADGITPIFGNFHIGAGLRGSTFGLVTPDPITVGQIFRIDNVPSDNVRIEADFLIGNAGFGDFEIGFNAVVDDPVFRGPQGYWVRIHPQGSDSNDGILKLQDGDGEHLVLLSGGVIRANEANSIRVDHVGSSISVFLNDSLYMSTTDTNNALTGGSVFVRFFGPGTIDNIRLTNLAAVPEPSSIVSALVGASLCGLVYLRRRSKGCP